MQDKMRITAWLFRQFKSVKIIFSGDRLWFRGTSAFDTKISAKTINPEVQKNFYQQSILIKL